MFSSKRFQMPALPNDWSSAKGTLVKAISDFFNLLNQPGALDLDSCDIRAATGIKFPVSWGAKSTDPNTLDDYQTGNYTPVVTPGSGAITAYTATGMYRKIGALALVSVDITITTNGTGAGALFASLPNSWFPDGVFGAYGVLVNTSTPITALCSNAFDHLWFVNSGGSYPGADGNRFIITSCYGVR